MSRNRSNGLRNRKCHTRALQTFMRQDTNSHVYGRSPSNHRIEAWWSFLRRGRSQWWLDFFSSLANDGLFHFGNWKELDCMHFCFMDVIRRDQADVAHMWNIHRIRPDRSARCPPGVPDELYYLPQLPAVDCRHHNTHPLSPEALASVTESSVVADADFGEYPHYLCEHNGWQAPTTVEQATALYRRLQERL